MDLCRFLHLTKCTLNVAVVIVTNLYCIPTYLLWMWVLLLPFRLLNHPAYWRLEALMYKGLNSVVASWSWRSEYHLIELGDDISSLVNERCVFLVNHLCTGDVPLLMQAFQEKGTALDYIIWIIDRMFRYTNFGLVSMTHGDYFITQGKNARDDQMQKLRNHLVHEYIGRNRKWIILFPEGGFLVNRLETSLKYAEKNNFPVLRNTSLPRVGAMEMILKTLTPESRLKELVDNEASIVEGQEEALQPLKWIVDVTVMYPDIHNPIDLLTICSASRPPCTTYLYYRCYPVSAIPTHSTDSLRDWVYARWSEKDAFLKEYYATRTLPADYSSPPSESPPSSSPDSPRPPPHKVLMTNVQISLLHTLFISSTLLHWYLASKLWSLVQY